jgi:hypothetical protein
MIENIMNYQKIFTQKMILMENCIIEIKELRKENEIASNSINDLKKKIENL